MGSVTVTLDATTSIYGDGGPTHTAGADQKRVTGSLAMSTSYAQGGDAVTAGQFGFGAIDDIWIQDTSVYGVMLQYTGRTASTVKMFAIPTAITTGGTVGAVTAGNEMTTGTDGHTVIARFFAWGA